MRVDGTVFRIMPNHTPCSSDDNDAMYCPSDTTVELPISTRAATHPSYWSTRRNLGTSIFADTYLVCEYADTRMARADWLEPKLLRMSLVNEDLNGWV
jgi:hypothetical protein